MSLQVRDREITVDTVTESLAGLKIPKVAFPNFSDWGERLKWLMTENVPGAFPFTAGVYPFKREGEDPTRQFAGEGTPERTNRRRSEEHTSELQSRGHLVCRLLLEKKNTTDDYYVMQHQ